MDVVRIFSDRWALFDFDFKLGHCSNIQQSLLLFVNPYLAMYGDSLMVYCTLLCPNLIACIYHCGTCYITMPREDFVASVFFFFLPHFSPILCNDFLTVKPHETAINSMF